MEEVTTVWTPENPQTNSAQAWLPATTFSEKEEQNVVFAITVDGIGWYKVGSKLDGRVSVDILSGKPSFESFFATSVHLFTELLG